MRVLIAGCGYVGTALGLQLAAAGHTVIGLRRDPEGLPDPIEPFAADLRHPQTLAGLPEVDAVAITVSADGRDEEAYRAAYLDGPATLLGALDGRGADIPVVFTSSTAVYGQDDGSWVDEDSPTEPGRFSGRIMLAAESQIHDWPSGGTALRLGGIYGPGRTRLVDSVRDGTAICVEEAVSYTNRIHRDDAAAALAHVLTGQATAPTYLVVDDDPAERCAVLRWLADRLDVDPPRTVPPDDPDAPRRRGANKRCSNAAIRATGWAPAYPSFRAGYGEMLGG